MSVTIKLRKNLSEGNRLIKTFASGTDKTYTGNFRGEVSILKPVFVVETSDDLTMYNYAEIDDFGRKYFASIRSTGYSLWEVTCSVDVLSTYATEIKACEAIVKRSQKNGKINYYMNDGTFYTEQRQVITYHIFKKNGAAAKLGTESYYLLVAGG